MEITEALETILGARYGREVRQAIHDGIKQAYDDAIKDGNANMEVSQARGSYATLAERLSNEFDNVAENLTKLLTSLEGRITKGQVTMADLTQEVKTALTGGAVAVVGDGAIDSPSKMLDGVVTLEKLGGLLGDYSFSLGNLVNGRAIVQGKIMTYQGSIVDSAEYGYYPDVPIIGGEQFTISHARSTSVVYLDNTGEAIDYYQQTGVGTNVTLTAPARAVKMSLNVHLDGQSGYTVVYGTDITQTDTYFTFNKLRVGGAPETNTNPWVGKTLRTFGDSITWYDGKSFGASHLDVGQPVVGYQQVLRDKLGLTVENQGVSGNTMPLTLNRIKTVGVGTANVISVTSGANDWTQQLPVGQLMPPKSAFDETTFYGALQAFVEYAISLNPNIKILMISPIKGYHPLSMHTGVYADGVVVGDMVEMPEMYCKATKEVAEMYGQPFLDLRYSTGLNHLNYPSLLRDDPVKTSNKYVHPGNELFEIMGKSIAEQMKSISV